MAGSQDFAAHFGPENIPFGIASSASRPSPQAVTRLGNSIIFLADLDLSALSLPDGIFSEPTLNAFAALGRKTHTEVRQAVQRLIAQNSLPETCQESLSAVRMHLPVAGGAHGWEVQPAPGSERLPVAYAGRAGSIIVSGTDVRRPRGQYFKYGQEGLAGGRKEVVYGPSIWMDYELEMAGGGRARVWVLALNDWSARDFQQLEMIPLGPLNSKHGATSVSAWVITPDALAPFKTPLKNPRTAAAAAAAATQQQHSSSRSRSRWPSTNAAEMDWAFKQIVAHQSRAPEK
ncbi:Fumarylacetoacetase [Coniochaeta hoffmannii]|uniref:Fumarylacetoacetase n=1 Tax=Coniochaeta hoffmannii TaxID=91930 RepID=A0AA38VKJ9_9PEZI|nr:Fumarylacetoacetase [Coniochaeta hoffmannii]